MKLRSIPRLHWKLYIPLVAMLWLIIGITIIYFVSHERQRQRENLENRLLNVNNTVIDAYERGVDLQSTVNFIRLFIDNTTLAPLRITVYAKDGRMVADNAEKTIHLYDDQGNPDPEMLMLFNGAHNSRVRDIMTDNEMNMVSVKISNDGDIYTFAALPYADEVVDFLSIDPMVWILVILLGIITSVLAYFGVHAVCRNVYALRDFASAIASNNVPNDINSWNFSKDELGDVSRNLLTTYLDKIHAEQEKSHYERQISMNISHELNTPVGIIKGYLDTVLSDPEMTAQLRTDFLKRAQQNTDRLSGLISNVRTVMQLGDSRYSLQLSVIDFRKFIDRIVLDSTYGNVAPGMTLTSDIPEGCLVEGNESLLTNVLLNLIYNSALHSGGTEIEIKWIEEKNSLHYFSFTDNGRGVAEPHLPRLFDLFYRADSGRSRKNGGSGLGLSLVQKIIKAHGGEIYATNNESGGLKFIFSLPASLDDSPLK